MNVRMKEWYLRKSYGYIPFLAIGLMRAATITININNLHAQLVEKANQGHPLAQYYMGARLVDSLDHKDVAFEFLKKAADQGEPCSANHLGHLYLDRFDNNRAAKSNTYLDIATHHGSRSCVNRNFITQCLQINLMKRLFIKIY